MFILGLIIGAFLGAFIMALCSVSSDSDKKGRK